MNIIKEVLLNQAIKFPFVREIAKKSHSTGINNNPDIVKEKYKYFTRWVEVKGKKVLELGPGQTIEVIELAKKSGASKVAVVDIEQYIDTVTLQKKGIDFYLYDGKTLPFPDESFDIIWSNSVYEHIRYPEITVFETYRVLKKGGVIVHNIDLVDHFWYTHRKDSQVLNCLKYSKHLWNAMTWNRSNYVNRLRTSDWQSLHEKVGFLINTILKENNDYIRNNFDNLEYLHKFTKEDIAATYITLVATK